MNDREKKDQEEKEKSENRNPEGLPGEVADVSEETSIGATFAEQETALLQRQGEEKSAEAGFKPPQDQFAEGIGIGDISPISICAHFRGVSGG